MLTWDEITQLVEQAKQGDRHAFGALTECFQVSVRSLALSKLRNFGDAEELTQDVFIHAMRKLPQLNDARAFAGWLRRITVRMALNRLSRRRPVYGGDQEVFERLTAREEDPFVDCERNDRSERLLIALRELKATDRAMLEAFYLRGASLRDLANESSAPIGTIKRRLFTARARLREALGESEEATVESEVMVGV